MIEETHPDELFFSDTEKTFHNQQYLPPLPLPDFDQALSLYLDSVVPHVTADEYAHTVSVVDEFRRSVGLRLYESVRQKAQRERNWLSEWWNNMAYLTTRTPCAPLINTSGPDRLFIEHWPLRDGTVARRTAFVLHYVAIYWDNMRTERLKIARNKKGDMLCMNQYRRFLNACRIPGLKLDHMQFHFRTESEGQAPNHVVVIRRGHFFRVPVTTEGGDVLTPPELELQLQRVLDVCDRLGAAAGVGALTAGDRTTWAQVRQSLIDLHPENQVTLEAIQSSIILVALDEASAYSEHEICYMGMAGEATNRWFDKPFTFITSQNGRFTSNSDHTPCEGIVVASMMHYCGMWVMRNKGQWQGSQVVRVLPEPTQLVFHVNDVILEKISESRKTFMETCSTVEIVIKDFTGYGRLYIRSRDIHVDTHIQIAIQYTYYRLYKRVAPTYETGSTRGFWHGRTETVRSCTSEALDFSKAMCHATLQSSDKYKLYKLACEKHKWLLDECQSGHGCDRLILGLYLQSIEDDTPLHEFFTDSSQIKSGGAGNFVISTSFLGYGNAIGGCPPMVEHGYGTFYKVNDNSITMYVTARNTCPDTDANLFGSELCWSLREMKELIEANRTDNIPAKL